MEFVMICTDSGGWISKEVNAVSCREFRIMSWNSENIVSIFNLKMAWNSEDYTNQNPTCQGWHEHRHGWEVLLQANRRTTVWWDTLVRPLNWQNQWHDVTQNKWYSTHEIQPAVKNQSGNMLKGCVRGFDG